MLAVIVSAGYVQLARSGSLFSGTACSAVSHPLIPDPSVLTIATMMITMVAGTAVIMWMAELITDRGIGNGMSVLIFTSVIAVVFAEFEQIYLTRGIPLTLAALAVVVAVIGVRGLHRAGAAAHPGPVREADDRRPGRYTWR